jgi:hypothetical protein
MSMKRFASLLVIAILSAVPVFAQSSPHGIKRVTNQIFATRQCFSKGGLGIINPNLYIVTKSSKNQLSLSKGRDWTGKDGQTPEVAIFFGGEIWSPQRVPKGFDLSQSIVISFEGSKIRFFDFGKMSGGYYLRQKEDD